MHAHAHAHIHTHAHVHTQTVTGRERESESHRLKSGIRNAETGAKVINTNERTEKREILDRTFDKHSF